MARGQGLLFCFFALGCGGATLPTHPRERLGAPADEKHNLYQTVRALIDQHYVDPPPSRLLDWGAARGMVQNLDAHSALFTPEEYQLLKNDAEGKFAGIGVEIQSIDGWLTVVRVFPSSPAFRIGLRAKDRFLELDGVDARDITLSHAVLRMRGRAGTRVSVKVRREGATAPLHFTLKREHIQIRSVDTQLLPGSIGYARLWTFQQESARDLSHGLDKLEQRAKPIGGLKGVMLDLRDNGGGLFNEAVAVADLFLKEGIIVSTRSRSAQDEIIRAVSDGTRPDLPMVILVNANSASASEIVAGALKDHRRALLVGERTFGKGSVQNIFELEKGYAVKLTVARYFTPSGRSIQAQGIEPDVLIAQNTVQNPSKYISEASLSRHLPGEQSAHIVEAIDSAKQPFGQDMQANVGFQLVRALTQSGTRTHGIHQVN